ncbi:acetyltransferase [Sphingobacterium sp. SG20118]|uniref:acetyltransferase n=1 Tax=Sphingobacterium sp. SG20118 TaxID=3367156 RepID=UPI0037DFC83D
MYLFGASGHGKVIAEIAESNNLVVDGFFDTDFNKTKVLEYPVFHEVPSRKVEIIIAIGNNKVRKDIVNEYVNFEYAKLIHARSHISKRTSIGLGTVIMAGVTVNVDVHIGEHCIINTNASVDHDCVIADFVHISPNVALAGNVMVGEGTHVGIGAVVIQGVKIGAWCTIGAGAVIIKDIPDGCTVVGNPGKVIKK